MSRAIGHARARKFLETFATVDNRSSRSDDSLAHANPCYTANMSDQSPTRLKHAIARGLDRDFDRSSGDREVPETAKVALNRSSKRGLSPIYLDKIEAGRVAMALPRASRRRIAFGWYGGKFSHLEWLLPLLPAAHHYCEPFSGSAAVLLNREPSSVETYNDIDGEVVNFFKVLRDHSEELTRAIALTPFSREEFHRAIAGLSAGLSETERSLERARLFYIRARQTRTGLAQTSSLGRWANCRDTSRAGMSGVVSRWLGGVEALPDIAKRLLRVQVENRPAQDIIKLYDGPNTLFYCDPPYLHATRGDSKAYGFEMDELEHIDLASVLHRCKGKVALSGYRNSLMDRLFKDWRRHDADPKQCHSIKKLRQESLWMNY